MENIFRSHGRKVYPAVWIALVLMLLASPSLAGWCADNDCDLACDRCSDVTKVCCLGCECELQLYFTEAPILALGTKALSLESGSALQETAEHRLELWEQSFLAFSMRHQATNPEQTKLLLEALDVTDPEVFAEGADAEATREIRRILDSVSVHFSREAYLQILAGFGDLQRWLHQNSLIQGFAFAKEVPSRK